MGDEPKPQPTPTPGRPIAFRIYLAVAAVVVFLCLGYLITDALGSPRTADVFFKIIVWTWAIVGCAAIVILFREAARRPAEEPRKTAAQEPPAPEPPAPEAPAPESPASGEEPGKPD